jgi:hypothetical protein
MAVLSKFLNYLIHSHGVNVVNTNDFRDHTIDLEKDEYYAFVTTDFKDTIDWFTIGRVCSRLKVPLPDKADVED